MRRDPTSENSDLYEFKMDLFDNGDSEELFLFIQNFNMTLELPVTLKSREKIQYLCMMLLGEELHHFDTLSYETGSATPENLT